MWTNTGVTVPKITTWTISSALFALSTISFGTGLRLHCYFRSVALQFTVDIFFNLHPINMVLRFQQIRKMNWLNLSCQAMHCLLHISFSWVSWSINLAIHRNRGIDCSLASLIKNCHHSLLSGCCLQIPLQQQNFSIFSLELNFF